MIAKYKKELGPILIIVLIVLLAYWKLPNAFFEQDEWHTFGYLINTSSLSGLNFWRQIIPGDLFVHFAPLALLTKAILFKIFFLQAKVYFLTSIIFHLSVSLTVYFFLKQVIKGRLASLAGAIFFAVNSSHNQAITWIGTYEGTQLACLFGLLSLIFLLAYLKDRISFKFILSLIFLLVALLFKETAFTFLMVYFLTVLWYGRRLFTKKNLLISFLVLIFYPILRIANFFIKGEALNLSVSGIGERWSHYIFYNLLTSPLKIFSQIIIPQEILINISHYLTENMQGFLPVWKEGPWALSGAFIYDLITLFLGIIFILIILIYYRKSKKEGEKSLFFGFVIVFLTVIPLLIIKSYLIYWDSRYLYPASVGIAIFVSLLVKEQTNFSRHKFLKYSALLLYAVIILVHLFSLEKMINEKVQVGSVRRGILNQISQQHPSLPPKIVFYTESDSSYYGLPEEERIMPFQSGFGQTLLIWYSQLGNFPKDFYQNRLLWEIGDQGYKEVDGRGFGYFRDFENMADTLENYKLPLSSVVSFRFDLKDNSLEDMSQEVRGRIKGYLVNKKIVDRKSLSLISSTNNKDSYLANDGNIETFWDSKLPYMHPQFIEVVLNTEEKIAQIQIDSYNNKDQNEVGYRVSLFGDDRVWHEVFYAKRYPPDKGGIVNLYFEPQLARRIKIEQVGNHAYASWVIHELKIYEAVN